MHGIIAIGGRWDLEDPLSGLLLSAIVNPESAGPVLSALCGTSWHDVEVSSAWWPSKFVDLIVNFQADGQPHSLVLENKHVRSPSNAPGYRQVGGGVYWQTEAALLELDRVREAGEELVLGGPFDASAKLHLVVLDARGRSMAQMFPLRASEVAHRHESWTVLSYEQFIGRLRKRYDAAPLAPLQPILGQWFAFGLS